MVMNMAGCFNPGDNPFGFSAGDAVAAFGSGEARDTANDSIQFYSRNRQPLYDQNLGMACMLSGEVWNLGSIRKELVLCGHEDCSSIPEHVVMKAYAQWGEDCFGRFRGSFAIAIYLAGDNRLILARDRFGICTLFFGSINACYGFSSRIKGMLAGGFPPDVDEDGLLDLLSIGPGRSPGSGVFKGINELEPAQMASIGADGITLSYFYRPSCNPLRVTPRKAASDIYDMLHASVARGIEGRKVCTMLSGGLDSTAISSIAGRIQGGLLSFSIDYEGNKQAFKPSIYQPNTDSDFVQLASQTIGSMHENIVLAREDLLSSLKQAMEERDLPGMGSVDGSLLLFCNRLREWTDAALSGECADEFFLGYPWFHRDELLNRNTFPFIDSAALRSSILSDYMSAAPIADYTRAIYQKELSNMPEYSGEARRDARIRQAAWLTTRIFMQNLMERAVRMGEAAGLDILVPFCDEDLYEYLWNLPHNIKTVGNTEKGILRLAMSDKLPHRLLYRRKSPFPKTHDKIYGEMVFDYLQQLLDAGSPVQQIFNGEKLIKAARESNTPWFGQLMSGVQLAEYAIQMHHWMDEYAVTIR